MCTEARDARLRDYTSARLLSPSSSPRSMLGGCNYEVGRQRRARKRKKERERKEFVCLADSQNSFFVRHGDAESTLCSRRKVLRLRFLLFAATAGEVDGEQRLYCIEQYAGLFFFPVCLSAAFKYERSPIEAAHGRLINGAVFRCLFYAKPPRCILAGSIERSILALGPCGSYFS